MEKQGMGIRDYLFIGMSVLTLIVSCVLLSNKMIFWNDELFSWYVLSQPSFSRMWEVFSDKINNTPPLYFLLGWLWGKVFGLSELSLRLFSSLGICAALILVWKTLRQYYTFWPLALAVLTVFCTSSLLFSQNAEGRMYGLFLAVAAWTFTLFDRYCKTGKADAGLLFMTFLAHAALIQTHLHGSFYSGAILVAMIVYDGLFAKLQPKMYVPILLSWTTILLYLPIFLVQAEAGEKSTWMPEPVLEDLFNLFSTSATYFHFFPVVAVCSIYLFSSLVLKKEVNNSISEKVPGRDSLFIFCIAFLAVPVGVWLFSRIGRPIFFDRYLIPTAIGMLILLIHSFEKLLPFLSNQAPVRDIKNIPQGVLRGVLMGMVFVLCLGMLIYPVYSARKAKIRNLGWEWHQPPAYDDLPIVFQVAAIFHEYRHYSTQKDRYYFILDEEAAKSPASGQLGYQEYIHLSALSQQLPAYFDGHIIEGDTFLNRFDKFLVLDYPDYDLACPEKAGGGLEAAYIFTELHCPQWLEKRILHNPAYKVTEVVRTPWIYYLLVEKVQFSEKEVQ